MRIYFEEREFPTAGVQRLQHIGRESNGITLCGQTIGLLKKGVVIDVRRTRPLETPGISSAFCTACHSTFNLLWVRGVENLFHDGDLVLVIAPDRSFFIGVYKGRKNGMAIVHDKALDMQVLVPFGQLNFYTSHAS